MESPKADMDPRIIHRELFETLEEFYTLLIQLEILPKNALKRSNSDVFNARTALDAGFSDAAVLVLMHLPYLHPDCDFVEILPNTLPERYTTCPPEVQGTAGFHSSRELDTNRQEDVVLPPSFIKLTYQRENGHVLLYDTETRLMRDWKPSEDPVNKDNNDFGLIPASSPKEILGYWIDRYRRLHILKYDSQMNWDVYRPALNSNDVRGGTSEWLVHEALRLAELRIPDFYIECGWDVKSKDQNRFDSDKFIKMRDDFVRREIRPMKDQLRRWHELD